MRKLSALRFDADNTAIITAFRQLLDESYIVNDEEAPLSELKVQVKIDADCMSAVFDGYMDIRNIPDTDECYKDDYVVRLLEIYNNRIESAKAEEKRMAEYDKWLTGCFDKYVIDETQPSCKELAIMINNNETGHSYGKIKYQNIMRPLKAYREKKFK